MVWEHDEDEGDGNEHNFPEGALFSDGSVVGVTGEVIPEGHAYHPAAQEAYTFIYSLLRDSLRGTGVPEPPELPKGTELIGLVLSSCSHGVAEVTITTYGKDFTPEEVAQIQAADGQPPVDPLFGDVD